MAQEPLTVAEFRALHAEFASDPPTDDLVQSKLDAAWRRTPPDVWGDLARDAQDALAAHLLALSPFGVQAQLSNDKGESVYGATRDRMEAELGPAAAPRTT